MWRNVGIERNGPHLEEAGEIINFWSRYVLDKIFDSPAGWELQNMLEVATLVSRSAPCAPKPAACTIAPTSRQPMMPIGGCHIDWQSHRNAPTLTAVLP